MTSSTNTPIAKHENEENLEVPELPEETNEDTTGKNKADTFRYVVLDSNYVLVVQMIFGKIVLDFQNLVKIALKK